MMMVVVIVVVVVVDCRVGHKATNQRQSFFVSLVITKFEIEMCENKTKIKSTCTVRMSDE